MSGLLFGKILEMSLVGSWCIMLVLLVRLFLRRVERKYCYALWMAAFLSLAVPFSVPGRFSLVPPQIAGFSLEAGQSGSRETEESGPSDAERPVGNAGMGAGWADAGQSGLSAEQLTGDPNAQGISGAADGRGMDEKESRGKGGLLALLAGKAGGTVISERFRAWLQRSLPVLQSVWLAGLLGIAALTLARVVFVRKLISSEKWTYRDEKHRIVRVEKLSAPFLWGLAHPVIYLPDGLDREEEKYIIAHERCHRKRGDGLWKLLAFAAASVHWFNPLVWLAWILFCRDMEISCDEMVLSRTKGNIRVPYAKSLLKYAARQNGYLVTPLTFGEPSVKSRIRNVLRFRPQKAWAAVLAVLCVAAVVLGVFVRPAVTGGNAVSDAGSAEAGDPGEAVPGAGDLSYGENGGAASGTANGQGQNAGGGQGGNAADGQNGNAEQQTGAGSDAYIVREDGAQGPGLYRRDPEGGQETRIIGGTVQILGEDESDLYVSRQEEAGLFLDSVHRSDAAVTADLLGQAVPAAEITRFYGDADVLLFAAGEREGSMGLFSGAFYSYDRTAGTLTERDLTDAPGFDVAGDYVYYQKYRNQGEGDSQLYRADLKLEGERQIGDDFTWLAWEAPDRLLVSGPDRAGNGGRLVLRTDMEGRNGQQIFDTDVLRWEAQEYDRQVCTVRESTADGYLLRVEQWGYRENAGMGWRDSLLRWGEYAVSADGSGYETVEEGGPLGDGQADGRSGASGSVHLLSGGTAWQNLDAERQSAYRSVLESVWYDHAFPGEEARPWESGSYAVYDADGDGRQELLVNFMAAVTAGMEMRIYDLDTASGTVYEELAEYPSVTFYANRAVIARASHNHGMGPMVEDFWPYTLYEYDPEQDRYSWICCVDVWDRAFRETDSAGNPFPQEEDLDGDGILYYTGDGDLTPQFIYDGEAYREYLADVTGDGGELGIPWVPLTAESLPGSSEEERLLETVSAFAEAYFTGDADALRTYMAAGSSSAADLYTDGAVELSGVRYQGLRHVSEDGSCTVSLAFPGPDDAFRYLTVELRKEGESWKVSFYGLEG